MTTEREIDGLICRAAPGEPHDQAAHDAYFSQRFTRGGGLLR